MDNGLPGNRAARTIDLGTSWDSLPPAMQRTIGMAGIATALRDLAMLGISEVSPDVAMMISATKNFFEIAHEEAATALWTIVETRLLGGELDRILPPSLKALGVRQCEVCGCTDEHGCDDGCHWVGAVRCSTCGPAHA